jgi:hypothetical protein
MKYVFTFWFITAGVLFVLVVIAVIIYKRKEVK